MRRRAGITTMMVAAVLLAGTLILPSEGRTDQGPGFHRHGQGKGDFASHVLHGLLREQKDLNLSDEQVGKLKAMAIEYAKNRIRGEAEVKLAEVDVRALVFDEKAEMASIEAAMHKSEAAQTALRVERVKAIRAAVAVLTPEQREKWRAGMRERHRESRDRHAAEYGDGAEEHAVKSES